VVYINFLILNQYL